MGTYGNDIQGAIIAQIRAEVAANGWGQADLAAKTRIPTSTLSRYLAKTKPRDMPLPAFAEIASALGLTVHELAARAQRRLDAQDVL